MEETAAKVSIFNQLLSFSASTTMEPHQREKATLAISLPQTSRDLELSTLKAMLVSATFSFSMTATTVLMPT
jgi:hypothetical protein